MPHRSSAPPVSGVVHPFVLSSPGVVFPRACTSFGFQHFPIVAGCSLFLFAGVLCAQTPASSLVASERTAAVESRPPSSVPTGNWGAVEPGLREKPVFAQPAGELPPDKRGDVMMARKIFRSAVDAYQEAMVTLVGDRALMRKQMAETQRSLGHEAEARQAENSAKSLEKNAKELMAKQQMLPDSRSNVFTRMFAAMGFTSDSPAMPADDSGDAVVVKLPAGADAIPMPAGLSQREQAVFLAEKGQHEYALLIFRALDQQMERRHAVLWNKIGIAYHQMLDMDAASRCYAEALRTDGHYSEARNNLGAVYYSRKQYRRAVNEYKKALELQPLSASVYSNLGSAYFSMKRYEDASAQYARAVEIDPMIFEHRGSNGTVLQQRSVEDRASFHFYLSKVYARNGDSDRSLLYMRKALEEGFKDRHKFREDADFAALQSVPEFQTLLATEFRVL